MILSVSSRSLGYRFICGGEVRVETKTAVTSQVLNEDFIENNLMIEDFTAALLLNGTSDNIILYCDSIFKLKEDIVRKKVCYKNRVTRQVQNYINK